MAPVSGSVGAVSILNIAHEGTEAIDSNTNLPTPGIKSVTMNQYTWLPVKSLEAIITILMMMMMMLMITTIVMTKTKTKNKIITINNK
jgi:hypothetical protein